MLHTEVIFSPFAQSPWYLSPHVLNLTLPLSCAAPNAFVQLKQCSGIVGISAYLLVLPAKCAEVLELVRTEGGSVPKLTYALASFTVLKVYRFFGQVIETLPSSLLVTVQPRGVGLG